jgi:hypothetical protein
VVFFRPNPGEKRHKKTFNLCKCSPLLIKGEAPASILPA